MRRILALLVILAFWSLPVAEAKLLKPFQPPSLKKMTKEPLIKKAKPAGDSSSKKLGLFHRG